MGLAFTHGDGIELHTYGNTEARPNYATSHAYLHAEGTRHDQADGIVASIACVGSNCNKPKDVSNTPFRPQEYGRKLLWSQQPSKSQKHPAPAKDKNSESRSCECCTTGFVGCDSQRQDLHKWHKCVRVRHHDSAAPV